MAKKIKSVITDDLEHCVECGRKADDIHHIFFGEHVNREYAEQDGFLIPLCRKHHTGDWKVCVHGNRQKELKWKMIAQAIYEETHTRDEFRKRYGKSYL